MKRLTIKSDLGLPAHEQITFKNPFDPYGAYDIDSVVKVATNTCPIEISKQEQNWAKDLLHNISIRLANLEDKETNNIKNIKREVAKEIINIIEKHAPDSIDPASEAFKVIEEIISKFEVENE